MMNAENSSDRFYPMNPLAVSAGIKAITAIVRPAYIINLFNYYGCLDSAQQQHPNSIKLLEKIF